MLQPQRHRRLAGTLAVALAVSQFSAGRAVAQVAAPVGGGSDAGRIAPQELPTAPPAQLPASPPAPEPPRNADDAIIIVPELKGLLFLPRPAAVREAGRATTGVDVRAVPLLDTAEFRTVMQGFIGRELTFAHLAEIRALTIEFFRAYDRPFVDVLVPVQAIRGATVQIVALEFSAGQVAVAGNQHFATEDLQREVRLQPGGTINGSTVLEDVDWLNQNPFRQVKAEFQAGAQEGETDVTYRVQDRAPWRLYTSFQNNGSRTTGRGRLAAGFQWGDVFGLGHIASYQATVAPEPGRFSAHALSYRIPLPWRDNLVLSGNISRSDPDLANNFTQVAESSQVSARYHWRLPRLEALSHRIEIGPDFKRSTSNLNFFGTPVLTGTTEIVQLVTAYEAERPDDWGSSSAGISLTYSPGGLTGANESADFQPSNTRSGRQFADANYAYVQVHAERTTNLPEGFSLFNRVAAQVSNGNLLSSEQFGLGGSGSIRGYDERAVNGDRGALLSSELRSPGFSLLGAFGAGDIKDRMQVLAFWDYGFASLHQRAAGEPNTTYLSAVGVGLRYGIDRYLSLSADLGVPLRDVAGAENRSAWAHVAVTLSY